MRRTAKRTSTSGENGQTTAQPSRLPNGSNGAGPVPAESGNGGRETAGRFTQGCKPGPGNPYARQVAALKKAALAAVTEEDMTGYFKKLLQMAEEGDHAAGELLTKYTLG